MMTVLDNHAHDPAYSLAAEERMLTALTEGDWLMLWINEPSVILGKFQNPVEEVSLIRCAEAGVPLYRRNSGGGTVYHDPGNLNYTILTDAGDSPDYERFLSPVVSFLRSLGVPAEIDGSAITAGGVKISGNAQSTSRGRTLHHGTLLFDADLTVLNRLTGHRREKVTSRSVKSQPSPVGNIRPMLDGDMTTDEFARRLTDALAPNAAHRAFTEAEDAWIRETAAKKYRSWDWTFGRSPACTVEADGMTVEIRGGVVCGGNVPALLGCRFMPDEVRALIGEAAERSLFD